MSHLNFSQSCPICGRRLQMPVEYLGRQVACTHCGGHFQAYDSSHSTARSPLARTSVLDRAEALLSQHSRFGNHTLRTASTRFAE